MKIGFLKFYRKHKVRCNYKREMPNKIFVSGVLAVISIVLTVILFSGFANAGVLSKSAKGDNPLHIVIEPSPQNAIVEEGKDEVSSDELFGEEQVFPFVSGLGKNSGKS